MTMLATAGREQRITEIAHKIWEEEGRPEGQAEAHWARAESLVNTEAQPSVASKAAKPPVKAKAAPKKK